MVAGYLSADGHAVLAVDDWVEHVEAISDRGLRIRGARGTHLFRPQAVCWSSLEPPDSPPDLVLVSVKSADTDRAAELAARLLGDSTVVISTQNGLNEDALCKRLGPERVIGAVCEIGGYLDGPGEIVETRAEGGFVIGELDGTDTPRLREAQKVLAACAPTVVSPQIRNVLWSKLTWNCIMNSLTAITGLGQGQVWAQTRLRELAAGVAREAAAVAEADGAALEPLGFLGVDLPGLASTDQTVAGRTIEAIVRRYEAQWEKSTSMLQDVRHGRPTEVDYLNGHVVRRGRELGVAAPLNARLVELVHAVERGADRQGVQLLDSLVAVA